MPEPIFESIFVRDAVERCNRCNQRPEDGVLFRCPLCWFPLCSTCHARHGMERTAKRLRGERVLCDDVADTASRLAARFRIDDELLAAGLWGRFGIRAPAHPQPTAVDFLVSHDMYRAAFKALPPGVFA